MKTSESSKSRGQNASGEKRERDAQGRFESKDQGQGGSKRGGSKSGRSGRSSSEK